MLYIQEGLKGTHKRLPTPRYICKYCPIKKAVKMEREKKHIDSRLYYRYCHAGFSVPV